MASVHKSSIQTIIFDLGGVLINLSVSSTLQSFSALSGLAPVEVEKKFHLEDGFKAYEKGRISDGVFRDFVRETFQVQASDLEIDQCWNAMLLGLGVEKLNLLDSLKKYYRVLALSNTNNIHISHVNQVMLPSISKKAPLDQHFHRAYYSHVMGKRKPDREIYQQVIEENNLMPEETLFLDDYPENIQSAASLGIQTFQVPSPDWVMTGLLPMLKEKK